MRCIVKAAILVRVLGCHWAQPGRGKHYRQVEAAKIPAMMHVNPSSFNCPEVERFLYEYVECELDAKILIALDTHIIACPDCQKLTDSYREAKETPREHLMKPIVIPSDVKFKIVESLSQTGL